MFNEMTSDTNHHYFDQRFLPIIEIGGINAKSFETLQADPALDIFIEKDGR
jgi:hypothetical protein